MHNYKIYSHFPRSYESNTYLLVSDNGDAALIDPSCPISCFEELPQDVNIKYILLTHGHFDHILAGNTVDKEGITTCISDGDIEMLLSPMKNASALFFGESMQTRFSPSSVRAVKNNDKIMLGDIEITVLSTPGHTKGSVCYVVDRNIFTGDTLFCRSYGRTDLYGGDSLALASSLELLSSLEGEIDLFPGHGPTTALSRQKQFISKFVQQLKSGY